MSLQGVLEEGTGVASLDIPPIQAVGAVIVGGHATKRARTAKTTTKGRIAKRTRTPKLAKAILSPLVDKRKKTVEHLASAPDNEL